MRPPRSLPTVDLEPSGAVPDALTAEYPLRMPAVLEGIVELDYVYDGVYGLRDNRHGAPPMIVLRVGGRESVTSYDDAVERLWLLADRVAPFVGGFRR